MWQTETELGTGKTMIRSITLFHTSETHVDRFDRVRDRIAPNVTLIHHVRTDWLSRAHDGIDEALKTEIQIAVGAAEGAVLCTCTSIASAAEKSGAIRVDLPMMHKAAQIGGPVLLAYCLDSAYQPAVDQLRRAFGETEPEVIALHLGSCWSLFEAGEYEHFEQTIAQLVEKALKQVDVSCVVLAQASMAGAAEHIKSNAKVLTSVESSLRSVLEI